MNRLVLLLVAIVSSALLGGCAPKPFVIDNASSYASPGSAFDGQPTVYVMRDLSGASRAWPINIKLDGAQKGALRRGTYTRFAVAPGRHEILGHWNRLSTLPDVAVSSAFEAGKTYYFVIGTSFSSIYPSMQFGTGIELVKPDVGAHLIPTFKDGTPNIRQ